MVKSEKILLGKVVSDKMDKTIVVSVNRTFEHPVIHKTVTRSKKYKVHDQNNDAKIGDLVEIIESRPISKTKHMVLKSITKKSV
ncbi:MAG: 30S ribosomal protein S17 [Candidatus Babeliales bacterium]